MNYLTLDFETYYSRTYSLSKTTTQEYIHDPQFEVLMVALKWNSDPVFVLERHQIDDYFAQIDWASTALVCHNTMFDAAILNHVWGYKPAFLFDTMSMAQASGMQALTGSSSLASCIKFLQQNGYTLPPKGDEVVNALGKHREQFTLAEWEAYKSYCANDVEITWALFCVLWHTIPEQEHRYQDMIIRSFTEPMLRIHRLTVDYELARVRERKAQAVNQVAAQLGVTPNALPVVLRSNDKFADLLRSLGGATEQEIANGTRAAFVIPTKISPKTGKLAYAFGKSDEAFLELCNNPDPFIQALCQSRMSAKSSIEETRCELFQRISDLGELGVLYKISGAHTHRLSGRDGNYQNLPSGRKDGQTDLLRRSILAREGYVCVGIDSAQIEPRLISYVARQEDLLDIFCTGGDPYSYMAADIYGIPAEQIYHGAKKLKDPEADLQRQTGKVAVLGLGYQMGAAKLQLTALTQYGIHMTLDQAKHITKVYRNKMNAITYFWKQCEHALSVMASGDTFQFGGADGTLFLVDGSRTVLGRRVPGIRLPDGLWINYPNIRLEPNDDRMNYCFDKYNYKGVPSKNFVFGGKLAENLIQALAYSVLKWQALLINQRYPVKMNIHDEWVAVAPLAEAEACTAYMTEVMGTAPPFVAGLPLASEGGWAESYGSVEDNWHKRPDNPLRQHRFNPTTGAVQ